MLGKPMRIFMNSNGEKCFELFYKWASDEHIQSADYIIKNEELLSAVQHAIAKGNYVSVSSCGVEFLGDGLMYVLDGVVEYSEDWVSDNYRCLVIKRGYHAFLTKSGVYRVNL